MSVRLTATRLEDGNYRLRLINASFGEDPDAEAKAVASRSKITPPVYPVAAYRSNVSGIVYLVLKIGRDGRVEDVVAEQTNLTVLGNERQMLDGRRMLETASIAAARKWWFDRPVGDASANDAFWSVRVPVAFFISGQPSKKETEARYGVWEAYVPGPKNHVPWIDAEQNRQRPDALIAGTAYPVGAGPKLLTPLDQG